MTLSSQISSRTIHYYCHYRICLTILLVFVDMRGWGEVICVSRQIDVIVKILKKKNDTSRKWGWLVVGSENEWNYNINDKLLKFYKNIDVTRLDIHVHEAKILSGNNVKLKKKT